MKRILFIGNFLSKTRGTVNPSEKLAMRLGALGYLTLKASSYENLVFRFLHIVTKVGFSTYDVIHIDLFSGKAMWFALISSWIARWRKKKVVIALHGGKLPEVYQIKQRRITFLFNQGSLITPSKYLQGFFRSRGYTVQYIPNSIDLTEFEYGWHTPCLKEYKILWVRAFVDIYRPTLAVEILAEVLKIFPTASLTMIGPPGAALSNTQERIHSLSLENRIRILNSVDNAELGKYLCTHSIFLNTTRYESFGMGVVEAMSCGIPVVSASVGEIPYLWTDEINAMLISDSKPASFAKSIAKLFNDPNLARTVSINARQEVERLDWKVNKVIWDELFNR